MPQTPDFTWLFIKMLGGLILVLVFAFIFIRYILPTTQFSRRGKNGDWAHLLGKIPIDQRNNLYLVKILERYFVLSSGGNEGGLRVVSEVTAAEAKEFES